MTNITLVFEKGRVYSPERRELTRQMGEQTARRERHRQRLEGLLTPDAAPAAQPGHGQTAKPKPAQ